MSRDEEAALFRTTPASPELQDSRARPGQEQEVKLILAAWRSMCSTLQQRRPCGDSTAPPGPAQSFLATQRKSTQARKVPPPHPPPGCGPAD